MIHMNFCRNLIKKCEKDAKMAEFDGEGKCIKDLSKSIESVDPTYTVTAATKDTPESITATYAVDAAADLKCTDNKIKTQLTMTCASEGELNKITFAALDA